MIAWHVCSYKKLARYVKSGQINPPVRAWRSIEDAERMSLSSGRRVILRLRFPDNAPTLEGHFSRAVVLQQAIRVQGV